MTGRWDSMADMLQIQLLASDIRVPFWSMVHGGCTVQWTVAFVPALTSLMRDYTLSAAVPADLWKMGAEPPKSAATPKATRLGHRGKW
jgi:hypothetical protein